MDPPSVRPSWNPPAGGLPRTTSAFPAHQPRFTGAQPRWDGQNRSHGRVVVPRTGDSVLTDIVGRYAPSPTGPLHLGNLRTALLCWLHARANGGRMLLRMDDLDTARNRLGSAQQIQEDLRWLGLDWDGEAQFQSARTDRYQEAFDRLQAAGAVFPCRCSRKPLTDGQRTPDPGTRGVRYPGTCRPENLASPITADESVAWRFRVTNEEMILHDGLLGQQRINLSEQPGDFVVRRKDGIFAYQLASVVDDGLLGVTDVVRGEDLADSTARQVALFQVLGYPIPRFWHVPLVRASNGMKLSKRAGADAVAGQPAEAVIGRLGASLGLCPPGTQTTPGELLADLAPDFLRHLPGSPGPVTARTGFKMARVGSRKTHPAPGSGRLDP